MIDRQGIAFSLILVPIKSGLRGIITLYFLIYYWNLVMIKPLEYHTLSVSL